MVKRPFSHVASFKISLTYENTLHLLNRESGMPVHKARAMAFLLVIQIHQKLATVRHAFTFKLLKIVVWE